MTRPNLIDRYDFIWAAVLAVVCWALQWGALYLMYVVDAPK